MLVAPFVCLSASPPLLLTCPKGHVGMFATFNYVAGALYEYDEGKIEGLHVDFANRGVYYDPSFGNNWWEYFCAPIRLGASPTRLKIGRAHV